MFGTEVFGLSRFVSLYTFIREVVGSKYKNTNTNSSCVSPAPFPIAMHCALGTNSHEVSSEFPTCGTVLILKKFLDFGEFQIFTLWMLSLWEEQLQKSDNLGEMNK